MNNNQKWIPLKKAAEISGYSPDYIGHLIRQGKIPGKQVYYNIAWMTTSEAILTYKQREQKRKAKTSLKEKIIDFFIEAKQKIIWELGILKMFCKTFKHVLPIIIILIISFSLLAFYLFSVLWQEPALVDKDIPQTIEQESEQLKY